MIEGRKRALKIRDSPVDLRLIGCSQSVINPGEWARAEEGFCRQRRRVRGLDDSVFRCIDELDLCLSRLSPEHEDNRIRPGVNLPNDFVGEGLPAAALVRYRLSTSKRKD